MRTPYSTSLTTKDAPLALAYAKTTPLLDALRGCEGMLIGCDGSIVVLSAL